MFAQSCHNPPSFLQTIHKQNTEWVKDICTRQLHFSGSTQQSHKKHIVMSVSLLFIWWYINPYSEKPWIKSCPYPSLKRACSWNDVVLLEPTSTAAITGSSGLPAVPRVNIPLCAALSVDQWGMTASWTRQIDVHDMLTWQGPFSSSSDSCMH